MYQWNIAVSPWIDLGEAGAAGRVGKVLEYTGYEKLPPRDNISTLVYFRWKPSHLPSPKGKTPSRGFFSAFFTSSSPDSCYCRPDWRRLDLTREIPPDAEELQIGIGVRNTCRFWSHCTYVSNETPWFDDIRVGVFETPIPPALLMTSSAQPRDAFPTDPSPDDLISNPGRFDSASFDSDVLWVASTYDPFPSWVHVVFRVRPGPGIDMEKIKHFLPPSEVPVWFPPLYCLRSQRQGI